MRHMPWQRHVRSAGEEWGWDGGEKYHTKYQVPYQVPSTIPSTNTKYQVLQYSEAKLAAKQLVIII